MLDLHMACQLLNQAFGGWNTFLVGSVLTTPDYRDVDVRSLLEDEDYIRIFGSLEATHHDPLYRLMSATISHWLSSHTGLEIDWQPQPISVSHRDHGDEKRQSVGILPWACCVYYERAMEEEG